MSTLLTQGELNELKYERDLLLKIKNSSHENSYGYGNELSPREYLKLRDKINVLTNKIENAVVIPQISLNKKFTVRVDDSIFTMIITVNPIKTKDLINCTFDSIVGKALMGKLKGDIVEVETQDGIVKYEIIHIDEN